MKIPYVIDNIEHTLADVLNHLLTARTGADLDIATAYFSIRGFEHVRRTLPHVGAFRLLLGDKPQDSDDVGAAPDSRAYLRHELNAEPLTAETQQLVEELIAFLRRENVQARLYLGHTPTANGRREFLHAKCYLLYGGVGDQQVLFDHLFPLVGIVGSSNFTGPGLAHNNELNLVHKTILDADEVEDSTARREVAQHAGAQVNTRITPENAAGLIAGYDLVLDGSDNFATRYCVSDACFHLRKPLVTGAVGRFDGSLTVLLPFETGADGKPNPTYRCLFPEAPPAGTVPTCAEAGVLGALTGVIGTLMAMEAIKLVTGAGEPLVGRLLLYDALAATFDTIRYAWNPANPLSGKKAAE